MQSQGKHGRMLTVKNGFVSCPRCRRNHQLFRVDPSTEATRVPVWCRDCKTEIFLDIEKGQCFESRSQ